MVQCVHISSFIRIYRAVPLEHFTARVQYSIELLIPYSDTRPVPEAAIYYTVARNKRMVLHSENHKIMAEMLRSLSVVLNLQNLYLG